MGLPHGNRRWVKLCVVFLVETLIQDEKHHV